MSWHRTPGLHQLGDVPVPCGLFAEAMSPGAGAAPPSGGVSAQEPGHGPVCYVRVCCALHIQVRQAKAKLRKSRLL